MSGEESSENQKSSRRGRDVKSNQGVGKLKIQEKLPWWVELLFIQIGLPDSWLSKILKGKKKTDVFIRKEKRSILFIFVLISGALYINPIVKTNSTLMNCVARIENSMILDTNSKLKTAYAINFCNGGNGTLVD